VCKIKVMVIYIATINKLITTADRTDPCLTLHITACVSLPLAKGIKQNDVRKPLMVLPCYGATQIITFTYTYGTPDTSVCEMQQNFVSLCLSLSPIPENQLRVFKFHLYDTDYWQTVRLQSQRHQNCLPMPANVR